MLSIVARFRVATRPDTRFWAMQLTVWSSYGAVLMLPWLDSFSVSSMLPTKALIAGTGIVASSALALLYSGAAGRFGRDKALWLLGGSALVMGAVWSTAMTIMTGGRPLSDLGQLGVLASGLPQLGGALYHTLLLLLWSFGYLALRRTTAPARMADRLVLRDGRGSLVLGTRDIDWIEARGDYVRIASGGRVQLVRHTMARLMDLLPADRYLRVHRSWIVNVGRISLLTTRRNGDCEVLMEGGTTLPVSRRYAAGLREALRGSAGPPPGTPHD